MKIRFGIELLSGTFNAACKSFTLFVSSLFRLQFVRCRLVYSQWSEPAPLSVRLRPAFCALPVDAFDLYSFSAPSRFFAVSRSQFLRPPHHLCRLPLPFRSSNCSNRVWAACAHGNHLSLWISFTLLCRRRSMLVWITLFAQPLHQQIPTHAVILARLLLLSSIDLHFSLSFQFEPDFHLISFFSNDLCSPKLESRLMLRQNSSTSVYNRFNCILKRHENVEWWWNDSFNLVLN